MKEFRFDPRVFISKPYKVCPKCKIKEFGVFSIYSESYVRRCRNCFFEAPFPLPSIKKKVIYLDQFVLSNMMKAIHPSILIDRKEKFDPFWRSLFEKLDSLVKMQLVICPKSAIHYDESMVSPFYHSLKRMYDALGFGISFYDPDTIKRNQIFHHAKSWIEGNINDYHPDLNQEIVLRSDVHAWQNRIYVTIDSKIPVEVINENREYLESTYDSIAHLFEIWKTETDKEIDYWYKKEVSIFGSSIYQSYINYVVKYYKIQNNLIEYNALDVLPPLSATIIYQLKMIFKDNGVNDNLIEDKVREYLLGPNHEGILYNKIKSYLWASVARKAASGQKRLPSRGMSNDISALSSYLPFCDAMFIDNECLGFLSEEPLQSELNFDTKLFSHSTKDVFISYLDNIVNETPKSHFDQINEVYGENWCIPFTSMYEY